MQLWCRAQHSPMKRDSASLSWLALKSHFLQLHSISLAKLSRNSVSSNIFPSRISKSVFKLLRKASCSFWLFSRRCSRSDSCPSRSLFRISTSFRENTQHVNVLSANRKQSNVLLVLMCYFCQLLFKIICNPLQFSLSRNQNLNCYYICKCTATSSIFP